MPSVAPLSAAQLHEPILPFVRPLRVVLSPDLTIAGAIERIRAAAVDRSSINYLYVVGEDDLLVGVMPVRQLVTEPPDRLLREVMIDHVVAIPDWATVLIASEYFATRRLLAFPVVNARGQLLGVVDVGLFTNEVIDLAKQTYDDIFQLIGVHGTAQRGTWMAFRDRFPWLLANIAGGLLCAFIASRFEHLLEDVVVLPFNHTEQAVARIEREARHLAAVLVDPVPNRVGLVPARTEFLQALRDVTRAHGIVLIFDEVISFRVGYHGAQGALGVTPDMTTLGKIIGGGFPVGAVAGRADVMAVFDPTRGGSPRYEIATRSPCTSLGLTKCVMPNFSPSALRAGFRSTPMILLAPTRRAPCTTFRPMPPRPNTTTFEPGSTLAVLMTAPMPVVTPQPM